MRLRRSDRHGTRWKIGLWPLGGYVKMYGDAGAASTLGRGREPAGAPPAGIGDEHAFAHNVSPPTSGTTLACRMANFDGWRAKVMSLCHSSATPP